MRCQLSCVCLILSFFSKSTESVKDKHNEGYPWSKDSFVDHQESLLEKFRSNMVLDLKKDIAPSFLVINNDTGDELANNFVLKNLEGSDFKIQLVKDISKNSAKHLNKPHISQRSLSKSLDGLCAFLNKEYWSFEWCHRQDVRQVHIEFSDSRVVRNPDWKIGSYETTSIIREGKEQHNHSAPIVQVYLML